jgi:hypothetical protein
VPVGDAELVGVAFGVGVVVGGGVACVGVGVGEGCTAGVLVAVVAGVTKYQAARKTAIRTQVEVRTSRTRRTCRVSHIS